MSASGTDRAVRKPKRYSSDTPLLKRLIPLQSPWLLHLRSYVVEPQARLVSLMADYATRPREIVPTVWLDFISKPKIFDCGVAASGRGFGYIDCENRTVRDKALKSRIKQLAIPPAWTEVCIAEDQRAHIQAVGRDAQGRLQYRYHPAWEQARSLTKADSLLRLGSALPRLRDVVSKALSTPNLTRQKVVAAVVRLIDRALLRPGHEEYARTSGSRGASTLLKSDVVLEGDKVVLEFEGKSGKSIKREVKDRLLVRVLRQLFRLRGSRRLFRAPDDNGGRVRPITAREVNRFIADASGADISGRLSDVSRVGRSAGDFDRAQRSRNRKA